MKALDFPLLADENIHPQVIETLRAEGRDIHSVFDHGLQGKLDTEVLRVAHDDGRVVLTHDRDFGHLAIRNLSPMTGIIFLRPGHIPPVDVLAMLHALAKWEHDATPPFLAVVDHKDGMVRIRLRPQSAG